MNPLLSDLINSFKIEIERLKKQYSPEKTYKILKNNEQGRLITYPLDDEFFLCKSEGDYFEIKYNEDKLREHIFNDSNYKLEELEVLFDYFARHEFGHSQLKKIDIIFDQMEFCSSSIQKLCYTLLGAFKEFYADKFVDKNFDVIPHKHIQEWATDLSVNRDDFKNPEFFEKISLFLHKNLYVTERFYNFNKWDLLKDFYHGNNLDSLYDLLFKIFERFKEICTDELDLTLIREELFKLAKEPDDIDYKILLKIET